MKKPLKALIIEDEVLAKNRLQKFLLKHEDEVQIVAVASDGAEGLELINSIRPDVIFCDIQMPIINGLEMLGQIDVQPKVIFITAYDEYALRAFETNSIDYLLKPITQERLDKSIQKLKGLSIETISEETSLSQIKSFLEELRRKKAKNVLRVSLGNKIILLKLEDVQYLTAEDKLTKVLDKDDKAHFINPSLKQLEGELPENFIRVSRSSILNEDFIVEIRKSYKRKLIFEMSNGEKIAVGSSYLPRIKQRWLL